MRPSSEGVRLHICDETKFFDTRNTAETELSYGSKPSSTTPRGARFLHRLEPARPLPGLFLMANAEAPIWLDFIFCLRTGLTPSPTNGCTRAAFAPPSCPPSQGDTMTKVDDILMFCCVSAFFAGVIAAVTTLPV